MHHSDIIKAIEAHGAEFGLRPSTIGQMAVRNRHIHENLKNGRDIQMGTAQRLLDWIEADRAARRSPSEAAQ